MSTGGEVRKPWRARKTMAVSSRSQMEALKKAKRGGGALVAVAPRNGPEAKPFLDAKTLKVLLSHWYKDEVQHPLCPSLEVQPDVPPTAGEAPVFERVTDVGEAALGETVQDIHQRKKRLRLEAGEEAFPQSSRSSSVESRAERSDTKESNVKKMKSFIEEKLAISMEVLDHRLQDFDKRVERTQCLRKHEDISIKILKRVSRLERHLNRTITKISRPGSHSQHKPPNDGTKSKWMPSKEPPSNPRKMSHTATKQSVEVVFLDDNVSQKSATQAVNPTAGITGGWILNRDVGQKETSGNVNASATAPCSSKGVGLDDPSFPQISRPGSHSQHKPPNDRTKSKGMPSKEPPSNPRKMSHTATKQSVEVVFLDDNVSQKSATQAVNPTGITGGWILNRDVGQKETSGNVNASTTAPCISKNLFVIDLTEERNKLREDKEAKRRGNSTEEILPLNPLQPFLDASNQGPEDLSHLPPLPKAHLHPGPVECFQGTLSPQKPVLVLACLKNPKSIALQWGVLDPDPRCAPVESFHIFLCQEDDGRKGIVSAWREIHCILAWSLSMACSLADFSPNTWCYFAIRAKDVYGREGPFSDVRPIFNA